MRAPAPSEGASSSCTITTSSAPLRASSKDAALPFSDVMRRTGPAASPVAVSGNDLDPAERTLLAWSFDRVRLLFGATREPAEPEAAARTREEPRRLCVRGLRRGHAARLRAEHLHLHEPAPLERRRARCIADLSTARPRPTPRARRPRRSTRRRTRATRRPAGESSPRPSPSCSARGERRGAHAAFSGIARVTSEVGNVRGRPVPPGRRRRIVAEGRTDVDDARRRQIERGAHHRRDALLAVDTNHAGEQSAGADRDIADGDVFTGDREALRLRTAARQGLRDDAGR